MKRDLKLWPLVATIFFCVSGGPYGLEGVMQNGLGMGLLLILATPLVWAVPSALMSAELGAAMPVEGGYYVWVRRALGPFWGFLCAWWTWVYTWVDTSIYPVLVAVYVQTLLALSGHPVDLEANRWLKWTIGMTIVVPLTILNVRGIRPVGRASITFLFILAAPFVLMVLLGASRSFALGPHAFQPKVVSDKTAYQAFTAGLFVVMWNYLGWDSMSTTAAEVEDPQRSFPRALALGVPLVTAIYLFPALVGVAVVRDPAAWKEGTWTDVGRLIGGPWLAIAIGIGGLLSAAGQFASVLLAGSRIPFVLAEGGLLPPACARLHPRFGTPWVAILVSAFFYSLFSFGSFKDLAEVDVIVYSSALLLEFVALLVLRAKEPHLPRPYRIPGGWVGVGLVALLPTLILAAAVCDQLHIGSSEAADNRTLIWFTAVALATGPLMWCLRPLWRPKTKP